MAQSNVLGRRRTLSSLIEHGCIDDKVTDELLPDGVPLPDEDLLWDYKETLPTIGSKPTHDEKTEHAYKMGEIVKDTVAFYNTYGGYLLIGITDSDRMVCGYNGRFDANDLRKKLLAPPARILT